MKSLSNSVTRNINGGSSHHHLIFGGNDGDRKSHRTIKFLSQLGSDGRMYRVKRHARGPRYDPMKLF